jgi:hypothetical protein
MGQATARAVDDVQGPNNIPEDRRNTNDITRDFDHASLDGRLKNVHEARAVRSETPANQSGLARHPLVSKSIGDPPRPYNEYHLAKARNAFMRNEGGILGLGARRGEGGGDVEGIRSGKHAQVQWRGLAGVKERESQFLGSASIHNNQYSANISQKTTAPFTAPVL